MTLTRRRFLTGTAPVAALGAGACGSPTTANPGRLTLVVLIDSNHVTLQVALSQLNGVYLKNYAVVMAGTLVAIVPLVIVFLIGARHFIRNIAAGALKG